MENIIVSCDIIGHSSESSHLVQKERIAAINDITRKAMEKAGSIDTVWASGGDGGHLAFAGTRHCKSAIDLVIEWLKWSIKKNVPLRIVCNTGHLTRTKGADGRVQLVGHGINLSGRLLGFSERNRIVATNSFIRLLDSSKLDGVRFHSERKIQPEYFPILSASLLSVEGLFVSQWDDVPVRYDHEMLSLAIKNQNGLEIIYRAMRILQVNNSDQDARNALGQLTASISKYLDPQNLMSQILSDGANGSKYIQSMQLIERRRGEILCRAKDAGQTMFMILHGELIGYFPGVDEFDLGKQRNVNFRMSPGDIAGELAFALKRTRTATLQCSEDTALLSFGYDNFLSLSESPNNDRRTIIYIQNKMRDRVVQHICNTQPFLIGEQIDGPPSGPLANTPSDWQDLVTFFRIMELDWQQEEFSTSDASFRDQGIYFLLSGQISSMEEPRQTKSGEDEPVLHVNLPGLADSTGKNYELLDDVKIGVISYADLVGLGPTKYRKIVEALDAIDLDLTQPIVKRNKKRHIFLSYCKEDKNSVKSLREDLIIAGHQVWWDDDDLLGGSDWDQAIRGAIKDAYAVVVCFSHHTQNRDTSWIFKEVREAIQQYREHRPGSIFLIPTRLSKCSIDNFSIDDNTTMDNLHHIDLYPEKNHRRGIKKLIASLDQARNQHTI